MIKKIAQKIGIDKSIAYTASGRIVGAFGGIISTLFIARFMTGEEQGFYYTFGSILAIQVFFELGMNGIITQYVAHEASHLKWNKYKLEGDSKYKSRLASLLHFCIKWYLFFALFLLFTLIMVGFVFFLHYDKSNGAVIWKMPWIILCCSTTINLFLAPIFSFLEGLNKIKEVAKYRLFQMMVGYIVIWSSLSCDLKLYTASFYNVSLVIVSIVALAFSSFFPILKNIYTTKIKERVSYRHEIFPFQWKIALSWISGYFIFQLFNPVLFATDGAVVAGQMGMTLTALNAISSLSMAWTTTKIPRYSGLIELKKYKDLDNLFNKTTTQAAVINGSCLIFFGIVLLLIRNFHVTFGKIYLGDRFLDYIPMIMMMIPIFINQYLNAWATYLRCHKQEPFLYNSIVAGILCCISTLELGYKFGVYGITIGYCGITSALMFWGYYIFKTKKREWHDQ